MHSPNSKTRAPAGFIVPPKPKFDPTKLSERELRDAYRRNQNVLESYVLCAVCWFPNPSEVPADPVRRQALYHDYKLNKQQYKLDSNL
jgi:hypothetical protein